MGDPLLPLILLPSSGVAVGGRLCCAAPAVPVETRSWFQRTVPAGVQIGPANTGMSREEEAGFVSLCTRRHGVTLEAMSGERALQRNIVFPSDI